MVTRASDRLLRASVLALLVVVTRPLAAGPAPNRSSDAAVEQAVLHHAPPALAAAGEVLLIRAWITHPELVKRAACVFKTPARAELREVPFRRGLQHYVAVVPASEVRYPWFAYNVELELLDGRRIRAFASRSQPHVVQVPENRLDVRERALLRRLHGRRSVMSASSEYVTFGQSRADTRAPDGTRTRADVDDRYYRLEAAYTYRPLRFVSEFSLRAGVVRGQSPVPVERELEASEDPNARFDVGLNYGASTLRFQLGDFWHLEGEFLTSLTEVGFSLGGGGALLFGDPYGSKLTLGFESIDVFGTRIFSRLDIASHERFSISPIVEITNMPHADVYGVRLLGELGIPFDGGLSLAVRSGYQARLAASGGPSLGATLAYAF
ncbi:MAG TPA: hypothetical protein VK524_06625 [Polyangiaceae bacterium]|nr:hypothetical protein [Polyangiaceae bacterium]